MLAARRFAESRPQEYPKIFPTNLRSRFTVAQSLPRNGWLSNTEKRLASRCGSIGAAYSLARDNSVGLTRGFSPFGLIPGCGNSHLNTWASKAAAIRFATVCI